MDDGIEWGGSADALCSLVPLVRVFGVAGVRSAVVVSPMTSLDPPNPSSSSSSISALYSVSDHVNLTGYSPLFGHNEERYGPRFPDCSNLYYRSPAPSGASTAVSTTSTSTSSATPAIVVAAVRGMCSAHLPATRRWLRRQGVDAIAPPGLIYIALTCRHQAMTCSALAVATHQMMTEEEDARWLPYQQCQLQQQPLFGSAVTAILTSLPDLQ